MTVSEPGPPRMPPAREMPPAAPPPVSWEAASPTQPGPMPGLRFGGFLPRWVALILDHIVAGAVSFGLALLFIPFKDDLLGVLIILLIPALWIAYLPLFWIWRGQTPGMGLFRLRIVRDSDGGRIGISQGLLRYLIWLAQYAVFFPRFLYVAFEPRKRGLHDIAAGTVMVQPAT